MDLQINGRVIEVLEEQSGEGRNGPWRKREFILETEGQYPKKVCIVQWGDDIDRFDVGEGDALTAHIDIQSREYNGRWYTDVKAWKIEKGDGGADPAAGDARSRGRGGAPAGRGGPSGGGRGAPGGDDTGGDDYSGADDDLPF